MDTSETYIKMCEKAEEIQKARPQRYSIEADLFQVKNYYKDCLTCEKEDVTWEYCPICGNKTTRREELKVVAGNFGPLAKAVWLPRQDQLQEMVGGFEAGFIDWYAWLRNIYPETKSPFVRLFTSFEQLWLAFVMKEKHGKVWSGEEWVNA